MNILFLAPMHQEFKNMKSALQSQIQPFHYKVVEIGIGKASAAANTALELSNNYDAVVLVGYAAASFKYQVNDFVTIGKVQYHDVSVPKGLAPELEQVYDLDGEPNLLLTGDTFITKDLAIKLQLKYGKQILFDMEGAAVAQICEWTNTPLYIAKLVSDIPTNPNTNFTKFVNEHSDFSQFVSFAKSLVE